MRHYGKITRKYKISTFIPNANYAPNNAITNRAGARFGQEGKCVAVTSRIYLHDVQKLLDNVNGVLLAEWN